MFLFQFFNTIDEAYRYADDVLENPLILVHSGHYQGEYIVVDNDVTILGAGKLFLCHKKCIWRQC